MNMNVLIGKFFIGCMLCTMKLSIPQLYKLSSYVKHASIVYDHFFCIMSKFAFVSDGMEKNVRHRAIWLC